MIASQRSLIDTLTRLSLLAFIIAMPNAAQATLPFTTFANHAPAQAANVTDGQLGGGAWQGHAKNHSVGIDFGRATRLNRLLVVSNAKTASKSVGASQLIEISVNYTTWQQVDQSRYCTIKQQQHTYTQCAFSPAIRTRFVRIRQASHSPRLKVLELVPQ